MQKLNVLFEDNHIIVVEKMVNIHRNYKNRMQKYRFKDGCIENNNLIH